MLCSGAHYVRNVYYRPASIASYHRSVEQTHGQQRILFFFFRQIKNYRRPKRLPPKQLLRKIHVLWNAPHGSKSEFLLALALKPDGHQKKL
jgi:hypothetical protein